MKKKWLVLGSAIGVSSVVMIATGFSALAGSSGYEAYKSALKTTKSAQSATVQAAGSLRDNGNVLVQASGSFKVAKDEAASGQAEVSANGTPQSIRFAKQAEGTVVKSSASDVYYVHPDNQDHPFKHKGHDGADMSQQAETVIDALVGNLKNYVTVDTQSDGSKDIAVQLDNAQIPAVINAIAPIAIKHAAQADHRAMHQNDQADIPFNHDALKDAAPQLSQDIKIEKVAVKAHINADNYIEHQEADITVSGKDDQGTAHQVTLHVQADLSNFNKTTPDTIDLAGQQVQTIQQERERVRKFQH
ncbi:hypothetical protein [Paenibacillus sp. HJGM_3]|uniref:hypothetical protein n=1 Tax=Paenibacillus sp. HJGM_3 TaxID=3379816 RepID=UPI003858B2B9